MHYDLVVKKCRPYRPVRSVLQYGLILQTYTISHDSGICVNGRRLYINAFNSVFVTSRPEIYYYYYNRASSDAIAGLQQINCDEIIDCSGKIRSSSVQNGLGIQTNRI